MRGFYDTPWDSSIQPGLRAAMWDDPSLSRMVEGAGFSAMRRGYLVSPKWVSPRAMSKPFHQTAHSFLRERLKCFLTHFLLDGRHNEGLCFQKQALLHCHGRREMGYETRETKWETCSPKFELEASVCTQARFYLTE